jgi:hypothetical protein
LNSSADPPKGSPEKESAHPAKEVAIELAGFYYCCLFYFNLVFLNF